MSQQHTERRERLELDACGIGFVADEQGRSSREIVELALKGLACVRHRGAIAADGLSGDGAGILVPLPQAFFARVGEGEIGRPLDADRLGVVFGYFDLDDPLARKTAQDAVAAACAAELLELAGWRAVPVDESQIGGAARSDLPAMLQALVLRPFDVDVDEAERRMLPRPSACGGDLPRRRCPLLPRELFVQPGHLQGAGHQ